MNPDEQKDNYWQPPEDEQPVQDVPEQADALETPAPQDAPLQPKKPEKKETPDVPVTWQAQEYVHMDKSPVWFVVFVIVVLALIAVDVFILKSWTFSALVIVMAVAVIIYTRRPPRELTYALSAKQGLYVGERLYHFDEFKAFGLIRDGDHHSIMLIPTKRFSPGVSVYFPEASGEQIVDVLGKLLPMEELKLDVIDVLVRKLRL